MSQGFSARFSREEMEAIRKSLRDETRFGADFMVRLKRVAKRIPFAEDLLAAWFCARDPATPMIVLGTAHPAKFPAAVKAACGVEPALPAHLADLMERKERVTALPNDLAAIEQFMRGHARAVRGAAA